MATEYAVTFTEDAAAFLAHVGEWLAKDPVSATIVTTIAHRQVAAAERGEPVSQAPYNWFAAVCDSDGSFVGAAMRTAPFAPYPLYVLAMPDEAARALGRALVERGEEVGGVNGALPASETCASEIARRTGRRVVVDRPTRLFELGELVEPPSPPGRLRLARMDEAPLALEWYRAFHREADEQAGREPVHQSRSESFTLEEVERWIRDGRVWFWADEDDRPVHLTVANPPAYGVARIGPVLTPKEHRRRGYAGAAVAGVARALREEGARVILFTDVDNPTSNRLYRSLGFRPVVDTAELLITDDS